LSLPNVHSTTQIRIPSNACPKANKKEEEEHEEWDDGHQEHWENPNDDQQEANAGNHALQQRFGRKWQFYIN
jgi:hypothetical protein